mmetsp:Transcript_1309/g.1457  ORF Transcript_1309/g.1457 Transcript_1309/m.1457 type:complete len:415 (-) Transcript_1309:200-1444(-)|eukprot:CAMPEP_0119042692 /NCGR_PEP_ID=MMETSP1177-20130426/16089_1 /TAXON_ID=2985 /ORGANISM="Ochromonas sp, Strain CCMP1899" /LENGTH=414 /DNA_ID=CAMNT_0007009661 /DNA_START=8 /DNA_END=1252 /DNA_ORIENTATION=+
MPKIGGKRRKRRTHNEGAAPEGATIVGEGSAHESLKGEAVPKSIVAKASKVVPQVGELVRDIRKLMSPFTASNLREKSFNKMKDYAAVAGQLGVTHIIAFSQTKSNVVLRLGRHPEGPTLHFKVLKYSLSRQVRALQKRPYECPGAYITPPLVVLNNFGQSEESQVKLMRITFQHMFPTINTKTVKLSDCRRVVLYHYHKDEGTVEMRHYAIRAQPVGVSTAVKRILQSRVPNLGELEDVSQFLEGGGGGAFSDSEGEDEISKVVLPDNYMGKGNAKAQQSSMKLSEIGPRITMELFKVEKGLSEGDVLFHKYEQKTAGEAAALKVKAEKKRMLKTERKAQQDANVARKKVAEDEKKAEKMDRKRRKIEDGGVAAAGDEEEEKSDEEGDGADEDDDDSIDDEDADDDDDEEDDA